MTGIFIAPSANVFESLAIRVSSSNKGCLQRIATHSCASVAYNNNQPPCTGGMLETVAKVFGKGGRGDGAAGWGWGGGLLLALQTWGFVLPKRPGSAVGTHPPGDRDSQEVPEVGEAAAPPTL